MAPVDKPQSAGFPADIIATLLVTIIAIVVTQWPLVATRTARWRPITVGLTTFITEAGPQSQLRMAGAVIAVLPVVLAYFIAQKQFTEAISRSGIKG